MGGCWGTANRNPGTAKYDNFQLVSNAGSTVANVQWLVADQLGTPRMIFDKTGSLATTKRHDYLPFGEELLAGVGGRTTALGYTGDTLRQQFTSKERDIETGLDFFEARYFSSTQGRFTRPDPILSSGVPTNPQTWNRYTYCLNNPLAYVDPTGMWNWSKALGGNRTDEQLREQQRRIGEDESITAEDRQAQIADIDAILTARQEFRDALDTANLVVERADLSSEERAAARAFLRGYGTENDGNGVVLAVSNASSGTAFTREQNGQIIVAITPSQLSNPNTLWGAVLHESVHVFQSRARSLLGLNPSLAGAEFQAYYGVASLVRGLDSAMVRYGNAPPNQGYSAGSPPIVLWQRGWREVDMRNGIQQHLQRLGYLDSSGNETPAGARAAFPGGGAGQWQ